MKQTLFILFIIPFGQANSQIYEIKKESYPFYNIVEWKGVGAILFNRDTSGVNKKIYMTLANDFQKTIWKQGFNTAVKDPYFITNENSKYSYFLENLILKDYKYVFTQVNSAGVIKPSISNLMPLFKQLGDFTLSEIQLIDIVTTDKALIHHFRYHDIKEKKYIDIAVFMTHHNLLLYSAIIGETTEFALKEGNNDYWKFIGSTDDQIYFVSRDNLAKGKGWKVKEMNSKAEHVQETIIIEAPLKFEPIEYKDFSNTGRNYLNAKGETQKNILRQFKGQFYLTGISLQDNKRELITLKITLGKWEKISSYPLQVEKGKDVAKLGLYVINEGLGVKIEQGNIANIVFMPFDKSKEIILTPFTTKITFNPSRMIIKERPDEFVYNLPTMNVYFDYKQLNINESVKLEVVKR